MDLSDREYYVHDADCSETNFTEPEGGLKTCLDCAGIFDAETGEGIAVTSPRLDADYEEKQAEIAEDSGGVES